MLDHLTVINEYASIRRGEHPAWDGDRIANSDYFAWTVGRDFPEDAMSLIQSVKDATNEYSRLTGLPERSLLIFCSECIKGINSIKS